MMSRILALDIGDQRIGVAVSDALGWTAQPVKTIQRIGKKKDAEAIEQLIRELGVSDLVVGLPKNMNGTVGPQGEKTMEFAEYLHRRTKLPLHYQDERLTTVSAEAILIEGNVRREDRKKYVDTVAATFILQTFLDSGRNKK